MPKTAQADYQSLLEMFCSTISGNVITQTDFTHCDQVLKAAVLVQGGAEVKELPEPVAGDGELVVRMMACGLCGTDMEKLRGQYTAAMPIIGHEPAGVVEQVGSGIDSFKRGDRVFVHHHVPCGRCKFCLAGSETMCPSYRKSNIYPGGFSELFKAPAWNVSRGGVISLPAGMSFDLGALVEPTACCIRGLRRVGLEGVKNAFIVGCGPVGLTHAILLRRNGIEVIASDVNKKRLLFAQEFGASHLVTPDSAESEVKKLTDGDGADLSIVASGNAEAIRLALSSTRRGGRVLLFGVPEKGSRLDYDLADLFTSEVSIITSYGATERETNEAISILSRETQVEKMVTHHIKLDDFKKAIEVYNSGEAVKIVITP